MAGDRHPRLDFLLPELFTATRWRKLAERLGLSPRQREVARLICRGCGNKEIACRLGISPDTVRMHLRGLFERLQVHERVGVVVRLVLADRETKE